MEKRSFLGPIEDNESYSSTVGPDRVQVSSGTTLSPDTGEHKKGWHICAVLPTLAPTPSPFPSSAFFFLVTSGHFLSDDYHLYSFLFVIMIHRFFVILKRRTHGPSMLSNFFVVVSGINIVFEIFFCCLHRM